MQRTATWLLFKITSTSLNFIENSVLFSSFFWGIKEHVVHGFKSEFLQVIFSMADEYVPEYVDKKALVERQAEDTL